MGLLVGGSQEGVSPRGSDKLLRNQKYEYFVRGVAKMVIFGHFWSLQKEPSRGVIFFSTCIDFFHARAKRESDFWLIFDASEIIFHVRAKRESDFERLKKCSKSPFGPKKCQYYVGRMKK